MADEETYYPRFHWTLPHDPEINVVLETIGAYQYIGTWVDRIPLAGINGYHGYTYQTFRDIDKNLIWLAREGKLIKK